MNLMIDCFAKSTGTGQMLDAMYGDLEQVTVSAEVKYRDGRSGVVETAVRVCTVC